MQRTRALRRSADHGEEARRSRDRTSAAPRRASSRQRAAPTKPCPPVTTKVFPSMPSFSLRCIVPRKRPLSRVHEFVQVEGRRRCAVSAGIRSRVSLPIYSLFSASLNFNGHDAWGHLMPSNKAGKRRVQLPRQRKFTEIINNSWKDQSAYFFL